MNFIIDVEGFEYEGNTFLEVLNEFHCDTLKGFAQLVLEDCCTHEDLNEVLPILWEIFEDAKDVTSYDGALEIIERYQQGLYKYDRNAATLTLKIEWGF